MPIHEHREIPPPAQSEQKPAADVIRQISQERETHQDVESKDKFDASRGGPSAAEAEGIKRKRMDAPNSDAPAPKQRREESLPIQQEQGAPSEIPAPKQELATFNDTGTRVTHENRTFHFKDPLNFVKITKDDTAQVYATDNIDRLRGEIGVQHPWEQVERPNSLSHEQLKFYTPLYAIQRPLTGEKNLHLFAQPETLKSAYPNLKLNNQSLKKVISGATTFHNGFSSVSRSDIRTLKNDGIPLIHKS